MVCVGGGAVASDQGGPALMVPAQYPTIQAAIHAASSPATILVSAGTYAEAINLQGKDVYVVAISGPSTTVIDSSAENDSCVTANSGEPLSACVSGFTLTGGAGKPFPSSYGFDHYGGGVYVGDDSSLCVENCHIVENGITTGTFAGGVYVGSSGSHVDIRRCLIAHNHAWASGGATLVDSNATMSLERCTVYGNTATSWAFGYQGGVSMANGGGVTLVDCIVWGNDGYQIKAFGGIYGAGTSAACTYSCVEGGFAGAGNIASSPLFVGAAAGDLTLQAGSPCVDAGDPASALDPDGTRADMGAFFLDQGSLVTALASTFGAGCGASPLVMLPAGTPVTGASAGVLIGNAPTTLGGLAIGFSDTMFGGSPVLPLPLAYLGMPSCELLQSNDVFGLPVTSSAPGTLSFSYSIPTTTGLTGSHVYLQAFCYAPGANSLEIIVSNGIDWRVGNQ